MAAFGLAWQQEADAIEGDFHLTADGQIVCMHDSSVRRTGGVDRPVAGMMLAEVQALDVGRWKDARFTGERPPTLAEVLASLPAGKRMLIEIKCGTEILPELMRVLTKARGRWSDLRIISFDRDVVAAARATMPGIGAYWLTDFKADDDGVLRPTDDEVMRALEQTGADGLDCRADPERLDEMFVQRLRSAGKEVHVWTVDDPVVARALAAQGVDSMTTNRPALIRATLKEAAAGVSY